MNSNPGRRSRAPIVEKIISHFDGEIPPVIARIDIVGVTRTMTDDEIRLARLCAATPGFAVIELVELKSAEVTVKSFKSKKNFRTHFKLNVHNEVEASCSCLEAAKMGCNHILTAAIVLREVAEAEDYLRGDQDLGSDWRFNLSRLIGSKSLTRSKKLLEREPMVLFFQMVESFSGFEAHPMMMGAGEIPADVRHYQDKLGEYLLDLVTRRELPQPFREVKLGELSEINLINATGLSLSLIKSALDQLQLNRVSYGTPRVYFWEGLADQLVFLGQQGGKINARLQVIGYPLPVKMEILKRESGLRLNPVVDLPEGPVTLLGSGVSIFYSQPLWLRAGSTIFRINLNLESFNQLRSSGTIRVPSDGVAEFYERHLPEIIGHLPFELSNTEFTDLPATTPVPRIYLTEKDQMLRIALRFGYGDFEVGALRRVPSHSFSTSEGPLIRIPRKADEELRWYKLLEGSSTGLKSTSRQERTTAEIFTLRKGVHPYDFLTRHLPRLVESGFEVYGESELTSRVNRAKPTISFQVSSGIDWFDLKAVASWGDQPVPLESLRRAMRRDERFIKLADGTLGEIPADWLDKYRHLFGLSEPQDDGCRVSRHHITLLNDLFADADSLKFDRKFEQACEWLGNFDGITPRLVPDSFRGELRLYQKAGFDWLYFLREAGFGGCLADDMGTGKTVQALSFLLSLKCDWKQQNSGRRKKEASPVHLLVVPRSLVVNWIREAERFTPDLQILDFAQGSRTEDLDSFNNYDLVITTYGILIREIDRLREFVFDTAILDEAQAIKNPVSESARAVRAINCRHRLTLTGTPVENNTLELWSQFAFLNPGLLGSVDYFREQFIGPIERQKDVTTANTLKRLIYPFILRRTKDQVISDLPPRTEMILWGEMESAQRAVYNATRDHYRDLLLNLIREKGVKPARFRVLEGLLRLRQICDHPKLVGANYKGDSAKMESLLRLLETARSEGHKIIVFSQFVKMLKLIEAELIQRGFKFTYLDGATINRQERVDKFQLDEETGVFLISLKAGGVGLNLTAADYVIHVDPWWNPAVEMQASDRAHRIGQSRPVFIYKLLIKNSVEERMLALQEQKRSLVTQLITTEAGFFKSLTSEDIELLFS